MLEEEMLTKAVCNTTKTEKGQNVYEGIPWAEIASQVRLLDNILTNLIQSLVSTVCVFSLNVSLVYLWKRAER